MKQKIIEIIEPSKNVFDTYYYFEQKIKKVLPSSKVKLIGSFAVPMCGKKEIDILIETDDILKSQDILEKEGFSKGPIINEEGFSRNKEKEIICELHILKFNAKKISKIYDKVTNVLKENEKLRLEFEILKRSLNGKSEEEYKKIKTKFLEENIFKEKN